MCTPSPSWLPKVVLSHGSPCTYITSHLCWVCSLDSRPALPFVSGPFFICLSEWPCTLSWAGYTLCFVFLVPRGIILEPSAWSLFCEFNLITTTVAFLVQETRAEYSFQGFMPWALSVLLKKNNIKCFFQGIMEKRGLNKKMMYYFI